MILLNSYSGPWIKMTLQTLTLVLKINNNITNSSSGSITNSYSGSHNNQRYY